MADVHYTDPSRQSELPEDLDQPSSASEYVSNLQPIKDQKKKSKRNMMTLVALLVLAAIGAGVYFLFIKPEPPKTETPQTVQQTETEDQNTPAETVEYNSIDLQLSFGYPNDWKLDDTTQGMITITSPVSKLTDSSGQQVDGKVVVTFLSAGSEVPAFGNSSATAVLDSEKITYDSPSQGQREQTYLSFAGFDANSLDAVFVTGDSGYQKDQLIPEGDIKKIEPIISVTFYACGDSACADEGSGALGVSPDEWKNNQMLQAAKALLVSLTVE